MLKQKTLEQEQAYGIWKSSEGKISTEDIAMLIGVSDNQIKAWKSQDNWEQKEIEIAIVEKIPYKPNTSKYITYVVPYLKDIEKWLSQGITDVVIRQKLKLDHSTWNKFKKEESELRELYSIKKELLVIGLEKSLYKKAHGFTATEVTKERDKVSGTLTTTKVTDKTFAPDSTALIFALSNLDPDNWKQKVEHSNTFVQVNNYQLDDLKKEMGQLLEEYKNLETLETIEVEPCKT